MFGLSTKEILEKNIKNACDNQKNIYYNDVKEFCIRHNENNQEDDSQELMGIRKHYFDAVYESVRDAFKISMPESPSLFGMCIMSPRLCGLPDGYTTDMFCDEGISAGATFAMCYYVLKRKPISPKDFRIVQLLNHYQNNAMNEVLQRIDNEA